MLKDIPRRPGQPEFKYEMMVPTSCGDRELVELRVLCASYYAGVTALEIALGVEEHPELAVVRAEYEFGKFCGMHQVGGTMPAVVAEYLRLFVQDLLKED